ncbi:MAG: AAA family ATPase [Clostridia bacterium]|nr:AAA family ATPase [Clostridia bacterium]
MPKIHIIGGPGSGKTTLAEKLSEEIGIPHYDLDDLQWDNSSDHYGVRRDPDERAKLLDAILQNEDWIIEGVYYAWCEKCFADADKIYLLHVPRRVWRRRIIHRFFRRKLGIEKGKRETVKSLFALLKWADRFETKNLPEIKKILEKYQEKVVKG